MAKYLKEDVDWVKILAMRIPDYFEELSKNFEMFIGDIKNYESIKGCYKGTDIVLHTILCYKWL